MPSITFERWDFGLDRRRDKAVADANRLYLCDNAYVTLGRSIKKRPGLRKITTLEAGTKGLVAGSSQLHTFYNSAGTITHANSLFKPEKILHPLGSTSAVARVQGEMFLGYLYVAARYDNGDTYHHYLDASGPTWIADVNCPNTEGILKIASKIFAPKQDTVRFCATSAARDWTTTSDAGFLPVGVQATGSANPVSLVQFRQKMAVLFDDSIQVWTVDPDPAQMAIAENVSGVGSRYLRSAVSLLGDTYFLADQGYRSISIVGLSGTLQDLDVGTPIDELVRPTISDSIFPQSIQAQIYSQIWSFVANYAWVYTFSRLSKISCWSRYTFPFTVDATASLAGLLYVRSGDDVYVVDESVYSDNGNIPRVDVQMSYSDCKLPGEIKMFWGADSVSVGTFDLSLKFDPNRTTEFETQTVSMTGDTSPEDPGDPDSGLTPLEVGAVKVAPHIVHQADEAFELSQLILYFEK